MSTKPLTQTQFADARQALMDEALLTWDDRTARAAYKATARDIVAAQNAASRVLGGLGPKDPEQVKRGIAAARRVLGL